MEVKNSLNHSNLTVPNNTSEYKSKDKRKKSNEIDNIDQIEDTPDHKHNDH